MSQNQIGISNRFSNDFTLTVLNCLPRVQVALAGRPPPAGVEAVEESAQGDAEAPPLGEAVLAAERDSLGVGQDEGGVGAVLACLS